MVERQGAGGDKCKQRCEKDIDKASKDFTYMKQIKNEHDVVLRDLDMIIGR